MHPATGMVCVPFDPRAPDALALAGIPTLDALLRGEPRASEQFARAVALFSAFLDRLFGAATS